LRHGHKALTERLLYFSAAARFNDIYDAEAPSILVLDELKGMFEKYTTEHGVVLPFDLSMKSLFGLGLPDGEVAFSSENHGVACFSKSCDNILMWAHYADNHRGYCIGLDAEVLKQELGKDTRFTSDCEELRDVVYVDEIPRFRPTMADIEGGFIEPYYYKFRDWKYEQEIRLVCKNGANQWVALPADCISEVIIGARMDIECAKVLEGFVGASHPSPELYVAKKLDHTYSLDFYNVKALSSRGIEPFNTTGPIVDLLLESTGVERKFFVRPKVEAESSMN
jgi:hypothetical protein